MQSINFVGAVTFGERVSRLLSGPNGVLMAALVATFGIYFISSCLYVSNIVEVLVHYSLDVIWQRDPWHMFSSFPQYLLIAPSFTNILNTYAFCNLYVTLSFRDIRC